MREYEFHLSTGQRVKVNQADSGNLLDVLRDLKRGHWFRDTKGWRINPAHVVMVRLYSP